MKELEHLQNFHPVAQVVGIICMAAVPCIMLWIVFKYLFGRD